MQTHVLSDIELILTQLFYLLSLERERERFVVPPTYAFMVDSCMCADRGLKLQSWSVGECSNQPTYPARARINLK